MNYRVFSVIESTLVAWSYRHRGRDPTPSSLTFVMTNLYFPLPILHSIWLWLIVASTRVRGLPLLARIMAPDISLSEDNSIVMAFPERVQVPFCVTTDFPAV